MLLTRIFHYIALTSNKFTIDESHAILHSLNTLVHSSNMLREEMVTKPFLKNQERVIHTAALLHDMVDHKYVDNPENAMLRMRSYFRRDFSPNELEVIQKIITTCSYTKVKKQGFPNLGEYQTAYHIVREADILCSYDFDRAMTYMLYKNRDMSKIIPNGCTFETAYLNSCRFFNERVFTQIDDQLFFIPYSQRLAPKLHESAKERIWMWKYLYDLYQASGTTPPPTSGLF